MTELRVMPHPIEGSMSSLLDIRFNLEEAEIERSTSIVSSGGISALVSPSPSVSGAGTIDPAAVTAAAATGPYFY